VKESYHEVKIPMNKKIMMKIAEYCEVNGPNHLFFGNLIIEKITDFVDNTEYMMYNYICND
jgi:hypothetical protein